MSVRIDIINIRMKKWEHEVDLPLVKQWVRKMADNSREKEDFTASSVITLAEPPLGFASN